MSATEIAAWWGAAIATLVLVWDIFKWQRSGPIVVVSANPNMVVLGGSLPGTRQDKKYIAINVTNNGDRPTTITHCVTYYYANIFKRLLNKSSEQFVIHPLGTQPIPHVLEPGGQWLGAGEQTEEFVTLSRKGHLCFGVHFSSRKRAVLQRVVIEAPPPSSSSAPD